jgi:PRTRC genetic system protein C
MTITKMKREFRFLSLTLPDPNEGMNIENVQAFFATTYPEISTAIVTGPEAVGDKLVYRFERAIEIRGASAFFVPFRFQAFRL